MKKAKIVKFGSPLMIVEEDEPTKIPYNYAKVKICLLYTSPSPRD